MDLDQISPLAWVAIAFIAVFTVAINFILIALLRNQQGLRQATSQKRMVRTAHTADDLRKATEVLRDPFAEENRQLHELSDLVHGLCSTGQTGMVENNKIPVLPKK